MRRWPAEWEHQSGVQLTWPHKEGDWARDFDDVEPVFLAIADEIVKRERLLVVTQEPERVTALLSAAGLAMDRIAIVAAPTNDTWARDHGALTVFDEDRPRLLDFQFNGWGLKFPADRDNLITRRLHEAGVFGDLPLETIRFVLEGGGVESDGEGTILTTAECLLSPNRNAPMSRNEIEGVLRQFLGARHILWLEHGYLAGDDTDSHIDTLARFCDPHTIAYVACDDPADEHYGALAAMKRELEALRCPDGMPYRLVPLPWPEACYDPVDGHRLPATYANFLIINGAVLMPIYGVRQDEEAVSVLQGLFPGREIVPINCEPLIRQHGSLHCVTMQFPEGVLRW
ncbi:MAG: agmatine deiminase family protein [Campylobacterales bacterium]